MFAVVGLRHVQLALNVPPLTVSRGGVLPTWGQAESREVPLAALQPATATHQLL